MNRFIKLNLQLFAEPGDGGAGGDDPTTTPETVSKAMYDKLATQYAEAKKQLKAKQTDDEKALEEQRSKDEELEELRAEKKRSTIINGLLKQGIQDEDTTKIAEAILSGDVDKITSTIANMYKNSTTDLQKQIDELKVTGIDTPSGSTQAKEKTVEDYSKMTLDERIELKNSNPDLFKTLKQGYEQAKLK
jgi:hypothetical protein